MYVYIYICIYYVTYNIYIMYINNIMIVIIIIFIIITMSPYETSPYRAIGPEARPGRESVRQVHPCIMDIGDLTLDSLWGSSIKLGKIHILLALPLRKDDTHKSSTHR